MLNFDYESLETADPSVLHFTPPPWRWDSPSRSLYNLWACIKGTGRMNIGSRNWQIHPGFAVILAPDVTVSAKGLSGESMLNVGLHFRVNPKDSFHLSRICGKPLNLRRLSLFRELALHMEESIQTGASIAERNTIARTMCGIFTRDMRMPPEHPHDRRIREQVEEFKEDILKDRSVPELAAELGLSTAQYTRRFLRLFRKAPKRLMVEERNTVAARLLRDSTMTIDQIATALGYRDAAYFSRQFKSNHGTTPGMWRHGAPHANTRSFA